MKTTVVALFAAACSLSTLAYAADRQVKAEDRLDASADVVADMLKASDKGIPQEILNKARCLVIIPGMKKAGFIVGAEYGRGFAVCRRQGGAGWSAPAAMILEGGSVGFQIGASEQDILLLVNGDEGMKHLLSDKFTIGGDASAAAGPIGRGASAQTDAEMHAEILSYSHSRGLFAGLALTGASLRPDHDTNRALYGHDVSNREILTGTIKSPEGAGKLERALDRYAVSARR